jgi:hypothetical protein
MLGWLEWNLRHGAQSANTSKSAVLISQVPPLFSVANLREWLTLE